MLIITDVEALYRIPDNELKKLTAKDRVIIFSRTGAQMPMSKFQALAAIKAKMEIIEAPAETDAMSEPDRLVYTGYLYGSYAATARAQEPVKIYSSLFDRIARAGAKSSGILKSMGKIQICGVEEKKSSRKTTASKKKDTPAAAPVKKESKPAKTAAEKKPAATVKKTEKKASPLIEKMCSLGLTDMKAKLIKNEEHIIKALKDAPDAEIGYKFQLKMYFGETDSVKIWDKTSGAFAQLKKLI